MRYSQMLKVINDLQPNVVLEIGTHKAARPFEWSRYADFKYYGFDVFEEGTDELNKKEFNGKGFCNQEHAEGVLDAAEIDHRLYKGLTSDTLPQFLKEHDGLPFVDFAFIDGGHSIDTIQLDWDHVRQVMNPGGIVVFDDYYDPQIEGVGCNEVVKDLDFSLYPNGDRMPGGRVYLAKVEI